MRSYIPKIYDNGCESILKVSTEKKSENKMFLSYIGLNIEPF